MTNRIHPSKYLKKYLMMSTTTSKKQRKKNKLPDPEYLNFLVKKKHLNRKVNFESIMKTLKYLFNNLDFDKILLKKYINYKP